MPRFLAPRIVRRVRTRRVDQCPVPAAAMLVAPMCLAAGSRQLSGDRRIDRRRLAVPAELRIGQAVARLAVVGIDDVTARAARMAIVAGRVVGPPDPEPKSVV